MADVKISELAAASAVAGTDIFPVTQSTTTRKATAAQVAAYSRLVAINNQTGTSYTFTAADQGGVVRGSSTSAQTYTIPTNASVPLDIGGSIAIRQVGAGAITLSPASGVTLNIPAGYIAKTGRQGAVLMIHKVASNEWDLTGDLATS